MNILIVDDLEENRYLLEAMLKAEGHTVREASNGAEALGILRAGGIDLIISDILMPVMDGFQLCRAVKTDPDLHRIPFIVYTATYTDAKDEAFARMIGADRFVVKPCEPEVFMKVLGEVIDAARHRPDAPHTPLASQENLFQLYSERLVRKLEQKIEQAEHEIEARRKAEAALRESQTRLIAAQRMARMGDFTWDLETGEVNCSEALLDLMGYDASERFDSDRVNAQIHHPEDRERIIRWLQGCIASDSDVLTPNEYRVTGNSGETLFVRTVGVVERRPGRKPRVFATMQDISERKRAELDLEHRVEMERLFGSISTRFVNLPADAVDRGISDALEAIGRFAGVDRSYVFLFSANGATMDNTHEWCADSIEAQIDKLKGLPADLFPWWMEKMKRLEVVHIPRLDDLPAEAEAERKILEGQAIRSILAIPLAGGDTLEGFVGFDAVKREKTWSEEDIGLLRTVGEVFFSSLRRQRVERERERLQAQLMQAQKMESVGRLAGGVAHDFNNMLNVILGHAEFALEGIDPSDPLHAHLHAIRKAAERSANLTRQLLAFARKQTVVPKVLDLNDTVEGMLRMLRRLIGEDIELVWLPGTNLWPVKVDPGQIDQILVNLCVNARDAISGPGRVTIETRTRTFDSSDCGGNPECIPGQYAQLTVVDDGCGMDAETRAHLFEPFFTTKEVGQGTGLGLATVYGIVRQNQGFINVYSEPGRGTVFNVYLPRHAAEGVAEAAPQLPAGPPLQGCETVLLVEDEPSILEIGTIMLRRLGYTVLPAAGPREALDLARRHEGEIHLLITDVIMPEMNGRELTDRILELHPRAKRLFMSGYTADAIAHHGVLDEGVHFLQKPFSLQDLAVHVRKALVG